ncbi:hypothetical protein AB1K32_19585 [Metabacillus dongyingensis]|uniref:hypothetical protein n=1 Tax=Metabacillus dongyingensis TaxID=2874282 RepID=UPI003B8B7E94
MVMIPIEVPKEFTEYYEKLFMSLAEETVEKVRRGYAQKQYMNKKEAAQYIGISFNTLQKLEKMGLPIIEIDGIKLVRREDIDCFLNSHK